MSKYYRAGSNGPHLTHELNVFNRLGKKLKTATILLEKTQTRPIDLTVDEQSYQTFMAQAGREWQLSLSDVKGRLRVAQSSVVQAGDVFERRVTHCSVISIDVESAHKISSDE